MPWLSAEKKNLLIELVKTDFKLRYKRTVLGIFWVVLKPLLIFSTIYFVFSFVFDKTARFGLSLLLGIFIFSFFSEGITRGMSALTDRAHLIIKLNFSKKLLVAVPIINALINFLICLLIFVFFWLIKPSVISISALAFPVIIFELVVLIAGISLFTSVIAVKLRDLGSIIEVLMNMLFYATPIIYPVSIYPQIIAALLLKNPLAVAIEESRNILIRGLPFRLMPIVYLGIVSGIIYLAGSRYFSRHSRGLAEFF